MCHVLEHKMPASALWVKKLKIAISDTKDLVKKPNTINVIMKKQDICRWLLVSVCFNLFPFLQVFGSVHYPHGGYYALNLMLFV